MSRCLIAVLAAALLTSLGPVALADQPLNTPPPGWKALFNGKDLTGWKGLVDPRQRKKLGTPEAIAEAQKKADQVMRDNWYVKDGILHYTGKGQSLVTDRDYGDFEMMVDWKIGPKGDSGVYLRGNPQVGIWDPFYESKYKGIGSGGLFNNKKNPSEALVLADNPIGEWNHFHIKIVGDRVTVHLNGKLVVDNTVLENYWEPGQPLPATGSIELQHHGNPLEFRNIYIRELNTGPKADGRPHKLRIRTADSPDADALAMFDEPRDHACAGGSKGKAVALFDGSSLDAWTFKPGGWKIEDGAMAGNKGAGYIWTRETYENFILDLEFKVSEKCNSGVFFRTDPKNPVQGGFEIQIFDSYGKDKVDVHDSGALYDAVAPKVNAAKKPGEWQRMVITANGPMITVELNGQKVVEANIDQWTEPNKNPDGSKNKFKTALKDIPRNNHIGFQDHGHPIWFRNVRITRLD